VKEKIQMVMLTSKYMHVTEETVVGCSIIYNSTKWRADVMRWELDCMYQEYLRGDVSTVLSDFCLDMLAGRIPLNKLMTALSKLTPPSKTKTKKR
jgi:hypothetical protein